MRRLRASVALLPAIIASLPANKVRMPAKITCRHAIYAILRAKFLRKRKICPKPTIPKTRAKPPAPKEEKKHYAIFTIKSIVWGVDDIRENVCVNDEDLTEFEGKHYCLFHLPTKDKDIAKFEEKFRERLKVVEDKIAEIEKLPEEEQAKAKSRISYDFRYVWFPSNVNFTKYKFSAAADFSSATFTAAADFNSATFTAAANFSSATFTAAADFSSATFTAAADFSSATFTADANFSSATFKASAYFSLATFTADANFSSATFTAAAYFSSATFTADAYFSSATFTAAADFSSAKFEETSQIFFNQTSFQGVADFHQVSSQRLFVF